MGEYAERIDNADELLDSFLEGFHDENAQVNAVSIILELGQLTFSYSLFCPVAKENRFS